MFTQELKAYISRTLLPKGYDDFKILQTISVFDQQEGACAHTPTKRYGNEKRRMKLIRLTQIVYLFRNSRIVRIFASFNMQSILPEQIYCNLEWEKAGYFGMK